MRKDLRTSLQQQIHSVHNAHICLNLLKSTGLDFTQKKFLKEKRFTQDPEKIRFQKVTSYYRFKF